MANKKVTELTELTSGAVANDDVLYIVDVSDTSGGASGTSKKVLKSSLGGSTASTTITVHNNSGGTIAKGKAVYITGVTGTTPTIGLASNLSSSTMAAVGLAAEDIANNSDGNLIAFGELTAVDTSAFNPSDTLYVGTLGSLTNTKPTGTALIQNIGTCLKVSAGSGSILVEGAGRTNDVPNIPDGQAFIGNASGVATPTALADVATGGEITDLTDTPASLGLASQVLQVNSGASALEWVDRVRLIDQLGDVGIVSPADRQVLIYNASGSNWRNGNLALAEASDVDPTTPNDGDVLTYDSATSSWRPQAGGGGGGTNTAYLSQSYAFFDNTHRDVYIPITTEGESTSQQRYNRWVAPIAGTVKSISWMGTTNLTATGAATTIEVRKATGASTYAVIGTASFSSISAYVGQKQDFASTTAFAAGDTLYFWLTNNFGTTPVYNVTGVILFDVS